MIAGNIVGKSMGIAAFGTAISAKVPLAILGSVMGASLAAHLMPLVASVGPPTLSLAQGVLIALVTGAGTGAVVVLTKLGLEEAAAKASAVARRFGAAVRQVIETLRANIAITVGLEASNETDQTDWFTVPEPRPGAFNAVDAEHATAVEYLRVTNPGDLIPELTVREESWKGQPVR